MNNDAQAGITPRESRKAQTPLEELATDAESMRFAGRAIAFVHKHRFTTFSALELASALLAFAAGGIAASGVEDNLDAALRGSRTTFLWRLSADIALMPLYFWANSDLYAGEGGWKGVRHKAKDFFKLLAVHEIPNVATFPLSVGLYAASNMRFPNWVGQVASGKLLIPVTYWAKAGLFAWLMVHNMPEEPAEYRYARWLRQKVTAAAPGIILRAGYAWQALQRTA